MNPRNARRSYGALLLPRSQDQWSVHFDGTFLTFTHRSGDTEEWKRMRRNGAIYFLRRTTRTVNKLHNHPRTVRASRIPTTGFGRGTGAGPNQYTVRDEIWSEAEEEVSERLTYNAMQKLMSERLGHHDLLP